MILKIGYNRLEDTGEKGILYNTLLGESLTKNKEDRKQAETGSLALLKD